MAQKNYYIILEIKNSATFEEIKSAYRILAKKYHPDKNIGNKAAEDYFKEVQEAYAVLSNPEKRKKYDQKLSFLNRPQPQQRSSNNGPQYTGNAYQYAQQQAQYKQQQTFSQTQKKQPEKKQESASWQILVSVGIALVLLYFIISYSTEKTVVSVRPNTLSPEDSAMVNDLVNRANESRSAEAMQTPLTLNNYDSPYTDFFGEEIYDQESKNSISFLNGSTAEAVICLADKNTGKTLRNIYVNSESQIKMNQIPDGAYFVKIYFGNDWDPDKTFAATPVKGGFKKPKGFRKLYDENEGILMKKDKNGNLDSYSTYEIKIHPESGQNASSIPADVYFKK